MGNNPVKSVKSSGFMYEKITNCVNSEAVPPSCSIKKVLLKISQNSQENTCARVSFSKTCYFIKKETLTQVFFCGFWGIFNNTLFYRTPPVASSVNDALAEGYFADSLIFATIAPLHKTNESTDKENNSVANVYCWSLIKDHNTIYSCGID